MFKENQAASGRPFLSSGSLNFTGPTRLLSERGEVLYLFGSLDANRPGLCLPAADYGLAAGPNDPTNGGWRAALRRSRFSMNRFRGFAPVTPWVNVEFTPSRCLHFGSDGAEPPNRRFQDDFTGLEAGSRQAVLLGEFGTFHTTLQRPHGLADPPSGWYLVMRGEGATEASMGPAISHVPLGVRSDPTSHGDLLRRQARYARGVARARTGLSRSGPSVRGARW